MSKQKPLLVRSGLTGTVYVVTRYRKVDGRIEAQEKHDVTEQFRELLADAMAAADRGGRDDGR